MPYMAWSSLLNTPGIGAGAANTTTALTDISAAPQFTLPANFLQVGSALRFEAFGVMSTTTGPPNLTLGIYYGGVAGTALATTGAAATTASTTNVPWRLNVTTHIRTVGATGTAISHGSAYYGSSVTALSAEIPLPNTALATVTIDTTAAKILTVGALWSSASNSITLHGFTIESLGV